MDPLTILAAFGPLAVELGKSLISRFIAPSEFKPATVEQWTTMQEMQLKLFIAMNEAGGSNPSYPWVEAIVRLQRPLIGAMTLATWVYTQTVGTPSSDVNNLAAAIGFYLFGDRTLFYARKKA